jgi:hypothetical protein
MLREGLKYMFSIACFINAGSGPSQWFKASHEWHANILQLAELPVLARYGLRYS